MLSEVTVIAEENLTKSKIFLSFFVFVYFGKKQEWIQKKNQLKPFYILWPVFIP